VIGEPLYGRHEYGLNAIETVLCRLTLTGVGQQFAKTKMSIPGRVLHIHDNKRRALRVQ